jgi:hypothetical protein
MISYGSSGLFSSQRASALSAPPSWLFLRAEVVFLRPEWAMLTDLPSCKGAGQLHRKSKPAVAALHSTHQHVIVLVLLLALLHSRQIAIRHAGSGSHVHSHLL